MKQYFPNRPPFSSGRSAHWIRSFLILPVVLAALLGGCSSAPAESPATFSSGEPVTLKVCVWADELTYATAAAEAYNAVSGNVTVQICPLPNEDYEQNMDAVLANSSEYDLVGIKGISKVVQLAGKGLLLDITDDVKSSISDTSIDIAAYGNMFNDITWQDRYYAIPTRTTCWALFYNKDLFDQVGLPYPEQMTWEEYRQLAEKLTFPDQNLYGGYFLPWLPNCIALQDGSYLIDDDTSKLRESLAFLNSLYSTSHVSYYEMEEVEAPPEDVYNTFESGRIAMVPNGEWMVNILLQDEASGKSIPNWDIAPMPTGPGQEAGTTWGQYQYMCLTASTKHPKEAFDFLMFLCGSTGAGIYANQAIIPAYSDDQIVSSYLSASGHESTRYFFEARKNQEQLPIPGYQETIEAYSEAAASYFSGESSLDQAMSQFESDRAAIFAAK